MGHPHQRHRLDLTTLEAKAEVLLAGGLAPSTARVYESGKRAFLACCVRLNLTPLPASEHTLILFVAELAQSLAPSSIQTYLAAVRHLHIINNLTNPLQNTPKLALVLKGTKRYHNQSKLTRLPITPFILQAVKKVLDRAPQSYESRMLWAACCTGFHGFMRSGEFTVPAAHEFNPDIHVMVGDVAIDSHSNPQLISIRLKKSKTDQFGKGSFIFLARTDFDLCPIAALLSYLAIRGHYPGALFTLKNGSPLTKQKLETMLRTTLQTAGIDPSFYNGHSFRGAATMAAAAGVQDAIIKQLGRWLSEAYQEYVKIPRQQLANISYWQAFQPEVCLTQRQY